ncbi:hypothetical protein CDEST_01921 [Colletotrichum destructivum]|uniref:Uncharacterized protein n=1 Tax=Colletotrichum destructivum TaxID=34406 RepID=A0AAX4I1B5_9PEZI|nr:hypothetical protein CDEST_01921 [Colletotrichum destructivum]
MIPLLPQHPAPVHFGRTMADVYEDLLFSPGATSLSSSAAQSRSLPGTAAVQLRLKEANSFVASSARNNPRSPFRPESKFSSVATPSASGLTVCLRDLEVTKGYGSILLGLE